MRFTISLKPHIHAHGVAEGESTGLGLSGYLTSLIVADLRSRGRTLSRETSSTSKTPRGSSKSDRALAASVRAAEELIAPIADRIRKANTKQK